MFAQSAKKYLQDHFVDGDKLAMMVVTEDEIRQVTGGRYPLEDMERLMELISRTPDSRHPDIDHNYWYAQKDVFRALIEAGIEHIDRSKVTDEINERNKMLTEELGLQNIRLSLDKEVRPMRIVASEHVPVYNVISDELWFTLPAGKTYGELLLEIDAHKVGDGHHIYLESMEAKYVNGAPALRVGFGS